MKKILILAIALISMTEVTYAQTKIMTVTRTNGTTHEYDISKIKNIKYSDSSWTSLGYCLYGEDFLGSILYPTDGSAGEFCFEYYVEVQERNDEPGLYRLVNPYSPDIYPLAEYDNYDTPNDYFIEINATDPNRVYIDLQYTGMCFSYYEMFYVYSFAKYFYDMGRTWNQIEEEGYLGTLKDGVITFPEGALMGKFPSHSSNYYYCNTNGKFKLDLNDKNDLPGEKMPIRVNSHGKNVPFNEGSMLSIIR